MGLWGFMTEVKGSPKSDKKWVLWNADRWQFARLILLMFVDEGMDRVKETRTKYECVERRYGSNSCSEQWGERHD
jgi:hypothetical protein